MRLCCAWLLWEHPYSEAGLNLVVPQVELFVKLNFGLFLVFCKERVGVCRQVPKKRVPVSGTGRDPLMDPMKSHQIFLLAALQGFQVSEPGWISTVKKAPGASRGCFLSQPLYLPCAATINRNVGQVENVLHMWWFGQ